MLPRLTCPDSEQLDKLVAGELGDAEYAELARHLDDCEACQAELKEWAYSEGSWHVVADAIRRREMEAAEESGLQRVLQPFQQGACRADSNSIAREPGTDSNSDSFSPIRLCNPADAAERGPLNPAGEGLPLLPARYKIDEEIARGGMGVILRGRDSNLGRSIAVKVMLEKHKGLAQFEQRFVEEAQIGGQLQHPGIVPVYDVGETSDQRAFFAMKLVNGSTLSKLLDDRDPAAGMPFNDLPRFLHIFEQVCQTIAYAHARGVIHRDLKPSNIMVGPFGEVLVMDWGLAKVLPAPDDPGQAPQIGTVPPKVEPDICTVRNDASGSTPAHGGSSTQAGQVLGTPAYMSPEQAQGKIEDVDQRSDVFGLGAILCNILTGKPPYDAQGNVETHQLAMKGDVTDAYRRLEHSGADADLVDLAKRCLAPEKGARPRDAGEVAAFVAAFDAKVQEQLRRSEVERAEAKGQARAERGKRRLTLGLAGALLSLIVVVAGGLLIYQQNLSEQRQRQAERLREQELRRVRAIQNTENSIEQIYGLVDRRMFADAEIILGQIKNGLAKNSPPELADKLRTVQADIELAAKLDEIRVRKVVKTLHVNLARAEEEYLQALHAAGVYDENSPATANARKIAVSRVRSDILDALDDWADLTQQTARRVRLLHVARLVDPHPLRDQFRNADLWKKPDEVVDLIGKMNAKELSPALLGVMANRLRKAGHDPVPVFYEAQAQFPEDFWLNFELAMLLHMPAPQRAEGFYRAALAIRADVPSGWTNLSDVLQRTNQLKAAESASRKAAHLEPARAVYQSNLGNILNRVGKFPEAERVLRLALKLEPKYVNAYLGLGTSLRMLREFEEAKSVLTRAIAIAPRDFRPYLNLGNVYANFGDFKKAEECYRAALKRAPQERWLSGSIAFALLEDGRFREAETAVNRCLESMATTDRRYRITTRTAADIKRMIQLEKDFHAIQKGTMTPRDAAHCLQLALMCRRRDAYLDSARMFSEAFAKELPVADNLAASHRYWAACMAVQGAMAPDLDAAIRKKWLVQARRWLRTEMPARLQALAQRGNKPQGARSRFDVASWPAETFFAPVREAALLARLSQDERQAWEQFWREVKAAAGN